MTAYQLLRKQNGVTTELTTDFDLDAVQTLCDKMNEEAPPNVVYVVEEVQTSTKPLTGRK